MRISRRTKVAVAAAAVVGAIGTAGAAFTATGLTATGSAASPQFIGGSITQAVSGATLSNVAYSFTDATDTAIDQVVLTFADPNSDGMTPTIAFSAPTPVDFTCSAVESEGHTSTCTPTDDGDSQTGAAGLTVTVAG